MGCHRIYVLREKKNKGGWGGICGLVRANWKEQEEDEMKLTVLCYKKCTTCQKALKWLDANGIEYEERPIKEEHPGKEELKDWYGRSGLPLKRFFNTSGNLYKEMSLKDKLPNMSEEQQLDLLATDGMLVKRPLAVAEDFVLTGFKEDEWRRMLCKQGEGRNLCG